MKRIDQHDAGVPGVGNRYPHGDELAVDTGPEAGNHSREHILYQPHKHECHIAFILQFYY